MHSTGDLEPIKKRMKVIYENTQVVLRLLQERELKGFVVNKSRLSE